jgi:fucose permease
VNEGTRVDRLGPTAPSKSFDRLAMFTFVALGLPDGMIGTAWPTLRHSFGAPLADLGVFLLVGTMGALVSSSVAGLLMARFGYRATIMLGGVAGALGATGIVLSPAFWAFVISGTAIGAAAGLLDSSVNTSTVLAGRTRLLNFLHGCYGVGTSLGPLIATAALLVGSWRASYGAVIAVELVLVAAWWLLGRRPFVLAAAPGTTGPADAPAPAAPALAPPPSGTTVPTSGTATPIPAPAHPGRLRLVGVVGLGLVVFMVYVGLEVGAGQWEPSFDRGPMHLSASATGLSTFGYWGALTLVRFALAAPRRPVRPESVVRWGCAVALVAAGVVWWRPTDPVALVALVFMGGALAGVFPALVVLTPARVGEDIAHHVIGWQIGAAGLGGSAISAVFGVIFQHYGLRDFGPALVIVGVVLMAGVLFLERVGTRPSPRVA